MLAPPSTRAAINRNESLLSIVRTKAKLQHFRQRKRDWGLKRALHWELMHAMSLIGFRLNYVNVGSNMKEILGEARPTAPTGYETRVVGLAEMLPHAGRVPDLSQAFLEEAFARGDVCTANFFDNQLVGFSFSSFTRARATDQLDVLVPAGFRYGYKSWTHPEHRRANLSRMRGYTRRQTLPSDRMQRSISYVETHNYPSLLHSYRHPRERSLRMGFCGWITVFGRQIPFNSRRAKWIGFEIVRRDDHRRRQYV
jgi:hypothetical protein